MWMAYLNWLRIKRRVCSRLLETQSALHNRSCGSLRILPKQCPSGACAVESGDVPAPLVLAPNFPNPFNPHTTIRFQLPAARHARLTIHDLRGRLVTTLMDDQAPAGDHSVIWTGRFDDGREAPSGVYFSRLEAGEQVAHGRMALVR